MPTLEINNSEWTTITATINYNATDIGASTMPRASIIQSIHCGWCGDSLNPSQHSFGFGCPLFQWNQLQRKLLGDPDHSRTSSKLNTDSYCLKCLSSEDIVPFMVFGYHKQTYHLRASNGRFRPANDRILLSDLPNYDFVLDKLESLCNEYREVESSED